MTLNGEGLKRRQTYEEVIEYIEKDPDKIVYPDRRAKFLRNGFELAFLDTHNYDAMIEQQKQLSAHQITQQAIRQAAVDNGTSILTEGALRQANAASSEPIQYRHSQDPNDYIRGGLLSSVGGVVSNVLGGVYSGAAAGAGALGSLFGGYGRPQDIPRAQRDAGSDAGSAYYSLPSEYQTADDLQSFYSAELQRDADVASQRSAAVSSHARQHLRDVGRQQEAILPLNTTDDSGDAGSSGDHRGVVLPLNTAAAGVGSLSSSSSDISSTIPAPPTEFYRMTPASSIASKSSPPVSIHSSPPVSVHSSPPVSVHSSPPVSIHSRPPVSVHRSLPVSIHKSPPVSVHSSPPESVHGNSHIAISVPSSSVNSSHSSSSSSHYSMYDSDSRRNIAYRIHR